MSYEEWYDQNIGKYIEFTDKMKHVLEIITGKIDIIKPFIEGRAKERDSFLEKCQRKKYEDVSQEMTDLAATRIIAYTTENAKAICVLIEHELCVDHKNSVDKGKLKQVDQVGYLSTHLIVSLSDAYLQENERERFGGLKCEIQVRTLLQHAWAEIEHGEYKLLEGKPAPADMRRQFNLTAAMLEIADKELQVLSTKIDDLNRKIKNGRFEANSLNEATLNEYLSNQFSCLPISTSFSNSTEIVRELINCGVSSIEDLAEKFSDEIKNHIISYFAKNELTEGVDFNYTTLIRSFLILYDQVTYFSKAWDKSWKSESHFVVDLWKSYLNGASFRFLMGKISYDE